MRGGYFPLLSSTYIIIAMEICLTSLTHPTRRAFSLALASAGRSNPARMAMMAMTTSSSIKVNARPCRNDAVKDGNATFPLAALGVPPRAAAVPEPQLNRAEIFLPSWSAGHLCSVVELVALRRVAPRPAAQRPPANRAPARAVPPLHAAGLSQRDNRYRSTAADASHTVALRQLGDARRRDVEWCCGLVIERGYARVPRERVGNTALL